MVWKATPRFGPRSLPEARALFIRSRYVAGIGANATTIAAAGMLPVTRSGFAWLPLAALAAV
jgi:hypothetical protein